MDRETRRDLDVWHWLAAPTLVAASLLLIPSIAIAAGPEAAAPADAAPSHADDVIIYGRADSLLGIATAASEGHVGRGDFETRPLQRAGELLETVPGLIATQHSGAGKANQYFLRGFNLDHGTDFAGFLDGVPLNYRSHGHGQGYLDLNFLIPETIEFIDYRKGPYRADQGDFATAGSGSFRTYDTLASPQISLEIGRGNYYRGVAAGSLEQGPGTLLLALEGAYDNGRYDIAENVQKLNGFAKYTAPLGSGTLRTSLSAYHVRFNSAEQVPERAITSGLIGRLGVLDRSLGGRTTRIAGVVQWGQDSVTPLNLLAYAHHYTFDLTSNFTYFLDDPINGDAFRQRDRRTVIGGRADKSFRISVAGMPADLLVGSEARYDFIPLVGLYRVSAGRLLSTVRQDDVKEGSGALFAEATLHPASTIRILLGVRADAYRFDVRSDLAVNSGTSSAQIVSPKASIAWQPVRQAELYLNYGRGFHSNDARGTSINIDPVSGGAASPVDPLVRAQGAEVGMRLTPVAGLNLTATAWQLQLASELLFLGDGGTTEPQGPSRRRGVELALFYQPVPWLTLDGEFTRSRGRLSDLPAGQNFIPGALESVAAAGLVIQRGGVTGTVRVRHFGSVALIEDDSIRSRPTTVLNARLASRFGAYELSASLLNLLGSRDPETSYYYASRLAGEPTNGIEDIHGKSIEPRQVRVAVSARF